MCWACLHEWIPCLTFDSIFDQFLEPSSRACEWLWYIERAWRGSTGFPSIADGYFVFPLHAEDCIPDPTIHAVGQLSEQEMATAPHDVLCTLQCATANVLTLSTGATHGSGYISARQGALMHAFHERDVHFVGVQESRSRISAHRETDLYHILAAPATRQGYYGVQLRVSKSIQVATEVLHVKAAHLRILSHDARHLIVRFAPPGLRLLIMVGHAPCDGGQSAAAQWWKQFGGAVPCSYNSWPKLCLIDANSRIGSLTSCAVGDHQADEENEAGALMHQWLIDHNMFAPQTMSEHHEGPPATFVHSKGNEGRIDFVLIDQCLRNTDIRTRVSDIDLSLQKTDHMPVLASIPVVVRLSACKHPKKFHLSNDAVVEAPGPISWATDVHTHAATLHSWLRRCQPDRRLAPRKKNLSSETWDLIRQKAYHWKRMRQVSCTVRGGFLRAVFAGWRSSSCSDPHLQHCSAGVWLKLADHEFALHLRHYLHLCGPVLRAVREDDRIFFQQFADRHSDESFPNLWKSLTCLLPKAVSKRRSNLRCIGPASSEITYHLNNLEAGEPIEYAALLAQCHRRQQHALSDAPLTVPLEHLPTRLDFEKTCSKAKRHRAPGVDGVTSDTLLACLKGQSEIGFLLVLKSFLLGAEPLQWKGGLMHIIPKKSGILTADMMRGIMLLTSLGKIHHATLRKLLIPWVTATKIPAQMGGFVGQQTSFATHMLRSFCSLAVQRNLSIGVVFVDVKAAFHSMLREHTFGSSAGLPARLQSVLREAGLDVGLLLAEASSHAQYFETSPNLCLQRAMQDAHHDTWCTLAGSESFCQTHRGSRPGSPLADIAYNVAMRSVLAEVLACLQQLQWLTSLAVDLPVFPPLVTWVDDLAIPIPAASAGELDDHLVQVLSLLDDVFRSYGLQLNRQAGKTEVVCQYRGRGAPACRHDLFIQRFGRLPMPDGSSVRAVAQYQHLGTSFSQSLSFTSELHSRLGKTANAYRQKSKGIFRNRSMSPVLRLQLLESLVLSILMYGSGVWPLLSHRQYCRLSHAIIGWQRQITGDTFCCENRISDADFLAKWKLPPLSARLAKHRLLYAFQIVSNAPQDLVTCITAEDADGKSPWCVAVRHAINWLLMHMPEVQGPEIDCRPALVDQMRQNRRAELSSQWVSLGLPLELPADVAMSISAQCDRVTTEWLSAEHAIAIDADVIIEKWLQILESADDEADPNSVMTWAFLQWGRDRLPDLIETVESADLQSGLERAFEELCACFPLWELLMQFDNCERLEAPVVSDILSPDPVPDTRLQHDLEPLSRSFFDQRVHLQNLAREVLQWPIQHGVPLIVGLGSRPTLLVLHLFSGRRRSNDCHDLVKKLASVYLPDFDVMSISVDTAIDSSLGDLSSGKSFSLLIGLADGGVFALNLTGPPCEMWTAARHIIRENLFGRGPRPLRSCASSWGVPGLSLRELRQLGMGSHLMLHGIGIELRVLLGGGGSLMEHPAIPEDPDYASIWRTDLHKNVVMRCPHAKEVYVEQWRYGADCVKPTILRGIGLPGIETYLHQFRIPGAVRPSRAEDDFLISLLLPRCVLPVIVLAHFISASSNDIREPQRATPLWPGRLKYALALVDADCHSHQIRSVNLGSRSVWPVFASNELAGRIIAVGACIH
eukprot:s3814_g6.t1